MKKSHIIALVSALGVWVVAIIATVLIVKHNDNQTVATGQDDSSISSDTSSQVGKSEQLKMSKLMSEKKNHLWFNTDARDVSDFDRNTGVSGVYVTNNGRITAYSTADGLTVHDINKLSDKQIIKQAKKLDKSNFNESKKNTIDTTKKAMKDGVYLGEDVDQAHAQGLIDQLNAIHYPKPQTNPIKIKAYDDGKSQDVVEEKLVVKYKGINYQVNGEERSSINDFDYKLINGNAETIFMGQNSFNATVDNVQYAGLDDPTFITKVKNNQTFTFDSYKDKLVVNKGTADSSDLE